MIKNIFLLSVLISCFFLAGCEENQTGMASNNETANTEAKSKANFIPNDTQQTKEAPPKQKILMAEKIMPLSELDPDQDTYTFVQLSGTLINVAKNNSWGVIQDGDVQYFAFGHAGMEMIKSEWLGEAVYLRAAVEKLPVTDNLYSIISGRGLKPENVTEKLNRDYQLNTTKFELSRDVSREDFEYMDKL